MCLSVIICGKIMIYKLGLVHKEGCGIMTLWHNKIFKCESIKEEKGFALIIRQHMCMRNR